MREEANNLLEVLRTSVSKFPKKVALVFGSRKITYQQLDSSYQKLASALLDLGIKEFDRIALWLPNCPEFVYSFFATLSLRAIVVPINTMFKREEARFVIEDSGAKILICSVDKLEDGENILSRLDTLEHIICLKAHKDRKLVSDFKHLIENYQELCQTREIKGNDLAEIVYTSGTTGKPKGACLTHKNLVSNIKDCVKVIKFTKRDSLICFLPLFHSFASTICMLLPLSMGAKIIIMRSIKPFKRVMRAVFKHRVTIFIGVPSLYNILSEAKVPPLKALINIFVNPVRLYISGAAALPVSVCKRFEKKFRRPLLQGYGLTEASPVVSMSPIGRRRKLDSVGLAMPSVEVKIVDKQSKQLSPEAVGELLVKGPNVMRGYYNLEEENRKALREGWLYTGDLAKIDNQGFIYIIGRLKEMINVRGFNVYPREIEDILYHYPRVKEVAVIGVAHRHRGEVPVAFIVGQGQLQEREIIEYLRANLASYKVPLKIIFRDNLPKNSTGKILKRELQEEIKEIFK